MKKKLKISKVEITKGHVKVICNDGSDAKISRSQRNVLSKYDSGVDYVDNIHKAFGNPNILDDTFVVIDDGVVKCVHKIQK